MPYLRVDGEMYQKGSQVEFLGEVVEQRHAPIALPQAQQLREQAAFLVNTSKIIICVIRQLS